MSKRTSCKQKHTQNIFGTKLETSEQTCSEVKQELQLKASLPEQQRRLVFVPSSLGQLGKQGGQELVPELQTWQAIVWRNGRALGRLISPRIHFSQYVQEWQKAESILCYSLVFDRWCKTHNSFAEKCSIPKLSLIDYISCKVQVDDDVIELVVAVGLMMEHVGHNNSEIIFMFEIQSFSFEF
eukprot:TRINITY_DN21935_c0_g2_i2.p2 TRINITY_DN21935_c0_g2~~TRINITY_DN21935_c0_g2_i2.p2  ORF type:complete len:183 (+),score=16.89 TRINITY_DN21935_c0_g2_i2:157-705(+)